MLEADGQALESALDRACTRGPLAATLELAKHLATLAGFGQSNTNPPAHDEVVSALSKLDTDQLTSIIRLVTARFHLLNMGEQLAIAHINRDRERKATPASPRTESIAAAITSLRDAGHDTHNVRSFISKLDIQPTLTAHPTEARRRTVLTKQLEVARCVIALRSAELVNAERQLLHERLDDLVSLLLATDDVRSRRLEVADEARNGLYFLTTSIWKTVPVIVRDIVRATRQTFGQHEADTLAANLPPILRYRSWIGGDRDGNPNVTHNITRDTLKTLRNEARRLWDAELLILQHDLSLSTRRIRPPQALLEAIERDGDNWIDDPAERLHRTHEPFRLRIMQMRARIARDETYTTADLTADLLLLRDALAEVGLTLAAERGPLADAIIRARAFGLHIATVDIRQHSGVHESALTELLAAAGVHNNYAKLDEQQKLDLLEQELANPRPLARTADNFTDETRELLQTLGVVRETIQADPNAIRAFVISMTHDLSDVLELLVLFKEAGLLAPQQSNPSAPATTTHSGVQIVPLFETVDDLERAPSLVAAMLDNPTYRQHAVVASRAERGTPFQEIMLGYSDSNKDGGFLAANAALQSAQQRIGDEAAKRGWNIRFFHGRGGTVGRGGGRAGRAILSAPAAARTGAIRFTEQGEVISFRYALPEIAHRHLEQIVHATLRAAGKPATDDSNASQLYTLMNQLGATARTAYRKLIDDPAFWPWYTSVTPIEHIGAMPIASRPVSRSSASGPTFDSLRAIPWVFAWIQIRALAPGWFGVGAALKQASDEQLSTLKQAYHDGTFVTAVIDNAAQELARTRLTITRRYASSLAKPHNHATNSPANSPTKSTPDAIMAKLEQEHADATAAILQITGRPSLLAMSPAIELSIAARNPWTDVVNLAQVELLRRWRSARENTPQAEELRPALLASINAIAAAMQSTG